MYTRTTVPRVLQEEAVGGWGAQKHVLTMVVIHSMYWSQVQVPKAPAKTSLDTFGCLYAKIME